MNRISVDKIKIAKSILISLYIIFTLGIKAQNITDITITVTFDSEPTEFEAKIAPLKYNKKFALSMQIDDGDAAIIDEGFPVFEGGTVDGIDYDGFSYTDGCGNNHSFKMSSAIYIFSTYDGRDVHDDPGSDIITWDELNTIYNEDWGVENHGESDKDTTVDAYIDYSIARNTSYTRRKLYNTTPGGVMTNVFVNPNGNEYWTQPALDLGELCALNQKNIGPLGEDGGDVNAVGLDWFNNRYNLYRKDGAVDLINHVNKMNEISVEGANYWSPIFTHNFTSDHYPFSNFAADFEYIYNTYGAGGSDEILMTTDEEILDYLIVRDGTTLNQSLSDNILTLTFSGTYPTNLLFYDLSLAINSDVSITDITIDGTEEYTAAGIGDTSGIVNISWDDFIVSDPQTLAENYVGIATGSQSGYDALIAMDYVSVLDYGDFKFNLVNDLCEIGDVEYEEGFCTSGYPDFVTITGDSIISAGEVVVLTATQGLEDYLWNNGETNRSITIEPEITTKYWVTSITKYGDSVSDTLTVVVEESYVIDHSPLVINHIVGTDDTLWVTLEDGATPLWDIGSTDTSIIVDPSESTVYHLDVYFDDEIVNELDFLVNIGNFLEFIYDSVCLGEITSFKNTSFINDTVEGIYWDLNGDTQFDDAEGDEVSFEYDASGIYLVGMRVYFKNDPMEVVYNPVPVGDNPVPDFVYSNTCYGSNTSFDDVSTVKIGSIDTRLWDFGDGGTDDFQNTSYYYNDAGIYDVKLIVWSDIGCSDSITQSVEIVEMSAIVLIQEDGEVVYNNDTLYFDEGNTVTVSIENFDTYDSVLWFDESTSSSVTIAEEGSFSVRVYYKSCGSTQYFNTKFGSSPQPSGTNIMNLFTPNGDGYNDYWIVNDSSIVAPFSVSVYNRNGKQVYSQDNYQNDWTGTYNGNVLPQGSYYYIIEDAESTSIKGTVTIIR